MSVGWSAEDELTELAASRGASSGIVPAGDAAALVLRKLSATELWLQLASLKR